MRERVIILQFFICLKSPFEDRGGQEVCEKIVESQKTYVRRVVTSAVCF